MLHLYGIRNCDTMKKARTWLEQQGLEYEFHDYKTVGVDPVQLSAWADELGWEALLNRKGQLWRKLPEEVRTQVDKTRALDLMLETPGMIKRPLLDLGDRRILGFSEERYAEIFAQ